MKPINKLKLVIESKSINESFARIAVSAFLAQLDPTIDEINDVKTAVSEAVTNAIVHGYKDSIGKIYITVKIYPESIVEIIIKDNGCGIENIKQAMEPLFTTVGGERAGLGFAMMETFMDKVRVNSKKDKFTSVTMRKKIGQKVE